jgi:hypothetical protein
MRELLRPRRVPDLDLTDALLLVGLLTVASCAAWAFHAFRRRKTRNHQPP